MPRLRTEKAPRKQTSKSPRLRTEPITRKNNFVVPRYEVKLKG